MKREDSQKTIVAPKLNLFFLLSDVESCVKTYLPSGCSASFARSTGKAFGTTSRWTVELDNGIRNLCAFSNVRTFNFAIMATPTAETAT